MKNDAIVSSKKQWHKYTHTQLMQNWLLLCIHKLCKTNHFTTINWKPISARCGNQFTLPSGRMRWWTGKRKRTRQAVCKKYKLESFSNIYIIRAKIVDVMTLTHLSLEFQVREHFHHPFGMILEWNYPVPDRTNITLTGIWNNHPL